MITQAEIDKALQLADNIGKAIKTKLGKYELHVRRYETDHIGFIELALRPPGASPSQDIAVAYSDKFFLVEDQTTANERAKRIFRDFKIHLGVAT